MVNFFHQHKSIIPLAFTLLHTTSYHLTVALDIISFTFRHFTRHTRHTSLDILDTLDVHHIYTPSSDSLSVRVVVVPLSGD